MAVPPVSLTPSFERNTLGQPLGAPVPGWSGCPRPSGDTLRGSRVRMERFDVGRHVPGLHAAAALDPSGAGWTYLPYGPFDDEAAYRAWAQSATQGEDPLFYAVVDEATGQTLGQASFLRIEPGQGVIEIGHIYFAPALQRTPAATEALALMLRAAFGLGYRRVEWKCNALNTASRRAAERLGFTFEGVFRQAAVVKGRNRDTAWYSMLDSEWARIAGAFPAWLAPGNFDAQGRQRRRLADLRAEWRFRSE